MKKLFLTFCFFTTLVGCSKKETPYLQLSSGVIIEFNETSESKNVNFSTNLNWNAKLDDDSWCSLNQRSGSANTTCQIIISVLVNPVYNLNRFTYLTISTENEIVKVRIEQKGKSLSKPTLSGCKLIYTSANAITCSSNIAETGGYPVQSRGLIWSVNKNPTYDANSGSKAFFERKSEGFDTGNFSCTAPVSPNTTYYVRAIAINSLGLSYSSEEAQVVVPDFPNCGKVKDVQENEYETVKIGSQYWLRQNLRTTMYNDGTSIPCVKKEEVYVNYPNEACTWVLDDKNNYAVNGCLYNVYVIKHGNLCPKGWHIPSKDEWNALKNYLILNGYNFDGTSYGNNIAKSLVTGDWNNNSTFTGVIGNSDYPIYFNKSGFSALPTFFNTQYATPLGISCEWWSSTLGGFHTYDGYNTVYTFIFYLNYSEPSFSFMASDFRVSSLFSVRCIKD